MGYECLGYSVVAYGAPEAAKFDFTRLVEPVAKGRDAKGVLTRKAKVGFWPCCAPTSFHLGEYSPLKELGAELWAGEGT